MTDQAKPDPFEGLLSKRVQTVKLEGLPEIEIREASIRDVKPVIDLASKQTEDNAAEIGTEIAQRLLGLCVYVGGENLGYQRVQEMSADKLKLLLPLMPTIYEVLGLDSFVDAAEEAAPTVKKSSRQPSERSSKSP